MLTYPLTLLSKPVNPNFKIRLQIYKKIIYQSNSNHHLSFIIHHLSIFGRIPRQAFQHLGSGCPLQSFCLATISLRKTISKKTKRISTTIPYAASQKSTISNILNFTQRIELFRNLNKTNIIFSS